MATVTNNPNDEATSGAGMIIGIVVVIILIALLFLYGLPALRGSTTPTAPPSDTSATIDVNLPSGNTGSE